MSAFLCGPDVFRLIALESTTDPVSLRWDLERARQRMEVLYLANLYSLRDRYSENPDDAGQTPEIATSDVIRLMILKQIACYEYQCCEWKEWIGSDAAELCRQAEANAIRRLPGWEDAPWGL